MDFKKLSPYLLPNRTIDNLTLPILQIIIGGITKYVLGGTILDFTGHFLVFIGCLNVIYFLIRDKIVNSLIMFVLIGALFLGAQMIFIELFSNLLGITPIFQ